MKKLLLIVISILIGQNCFPQECTEFLEKDVTNYSNSKLVESIWIEAIKNEAYFKFNLNRRKLEISYSSNSKEIVNKNDTILLQFENGKTLFIRAHRNGTDIYKFNNKKGIPTKWKNTYLGNLDILDNLSSSRLINIEEKNSGLNLDVNEKQANKIKEGVNCFYSEIDTIKDIQPIYLKRKTNNCDYFEYKVDNFTDKLRQRVSYTAIGFNGQENDFFSNALVVSLFDFGSGKGLDIKLNSINYCLNNDSYIMIKLTNNEIIKMMNSSGIDCGKGITLRSYLTDDQIKNLLQDDI